MLNISIIGSGNLGLSLAALCIENIDSVKVTIYDKNQNLLNKIGKEDLIYDSLVKETFELESRKEFWAIAKDIKDLNNSDIVFICVPSGEAIKETYEALEAIYYKYAIICSTLFIGEYEKYINSVVQFADDVYYMPVFLRAGTGFSDLCSTKRVVLGKAYSNLDTPELIRNVIDNLFRYGIVYELTMQEAELLKVVHNAFVATKITFANEIAALCNINNINAERVLEAFADDPVAITSKRHLKPGQPYAGPCLTNDTIRLVKHLNKTDTGRFRFNLLRNIHESNVLHILDICYKIFDLPRPVAIIGLGYKDGFNDLRNSLGYQIFDFLRNENAEEGDFYFYDKNINSGDDLLRMCRYNEGLAKSIGQHIPLYKNLDDQIIEGYFRSVVLINNFDQDLGLKVEKLNKDGIINLIDLSNSKF